MKRLLVVLLSLSIASSALAQTAKVTATIIDSETKEGVIGAIVELVSTRNSNVRKHQTSGYGGKTEITGVAYGEYTATVAFIGYENYTATIKVDKSVTAMGTIELAVAATRIDAVVKEVQSLRTSQNGDTVSYNAGAFKVAADADVEGLLKKMPGITITNGTVEAQGEEVKKIFVDGKEFFGEDVSTAINSLPAQAVDKIEVFNKLSDNAEFSGMDDGEGYKAINIITHSNMRQGQFGKLYAGYGYQPETDDVTSHHKYMAGGNVNIFNNSSRLSVIGLLNNINQQNFSFEDILGVSGSTGGMGGGMGRGVGQYMVRPQSGVAKVGSIGINYSDSWGENDKVKLTGSYFFNRTNTRNISRLERWYEAPSPIDTLEQSGRSQTLNNNHRLNLRLDWRISANQSLMAR
ncbi:MAG: carboxypeptidase-like regulatory domain-containing protein, partial [Alistipes sp.]|nr:carboxypeptidase-like regulatory domain-containing protein [Alistipes sp.]